MSDIIDVKHGRDSCGKTMPMHGCVYANCLNSNYALLALVDFMYISCSCYDISYLQHKIFPQGGNNAMKTKKSKQSRLILLSLILLVLAVALVGCDVAGTDPLDQSTIDVTRGKPATTGPYFDSLDDDQDVHWGEEGDVVELELNDQVDNSWNENDYIYFKDADGDGEYDAGEESSVADATHRVIGETLIGYYSSNFVLSAGQDIYAGDVTVSNDTDGITITITPIENTVVSEYHIYTYKDGDPMPIKRPVPGKAPVTGTGDEGESSTVTVTFTWDELGGTIEDTYYFAVHTALDSESEDVVSEVAGETAYASDEDPSYNGKGAWFYIIGYTAVPYYEFIIETLTSGGSGGGSTEPTWGEETAFAGNTEGEKDPNVQGKNAWWFYIDARETIDEETDATITYNEDTVQAIYAGQKLVDGAYVTYQKSSGTVTIALGSNMRLQDDEESIKIQGYDVLPTYRPSTGGFDTKTDTAGTINILKDGRTNPYDYVVIHFDAETLAVRDE